MKVPGMRETAAVLAAAVMVSFAVHTTLADEGEGAPPKPHATGTFEEWFQYLLYKDHEEGILARASTLNDNAW